MPSAWICSGPLVKTLVVDVEAVLLPQALVLSAIGEQAGAVEVADVAEVDLWIAVVAASSAASAAGEREGQGRAAAARARHR